MDNDIREQSRSVVGMLILFGIMMFFAGYGWYNRTSEKVVSRTHTSNAYVSILDHTVNLITEGPSMEINPTFSFDNDEEKVREFLGKSFVSVTWEERWKEISRHGKVIRRIQLEPKFISAN